MQISDEIENRSFIESTILRMSEKSRKTEFDVEAELVPIHQTITAGGLIIGAFS